MSLSIVIPVRNESKVCELFINVLMATIKTNCEILIVYDDKNDTTIDVIKLLQKKHNNIKSVLNDGLSGAVNAFKKGIEVAQYDTILLSSIDEIFPIIVIDEMYYLIKNENCDLVSGTRYSLGGKRYGGFFWGKNLSILANFIFKKITNFPLSDSTTGLKMFKKKIIMDMEIESNPIGWAFAFEISIKFYLTGAKFGEVPLIAVDRAFGGDSKFSGNTVSWSKEYFRWFKWGIKEIGNYKKKLKK